MNVYFGRTLQTCTLFPMSLIVFVEIRLKSTVFLRVRFRWSLAFTPVNFFVFDEWLLLAIILKIFKWELIIEHRQTCSIGSIQIEVIIYIKIKITRVFTLFSNAYRLILWFRSSGFIMICVFIVNKSSLST